MGIDENLEDMDLSPEDNITIINYTALRKLFEKAGRITSFKFLKSLNKKLDYEKFLDNPNYKKMDDRTLAWCVEKEVSDFNEDLISLRSIGKLMAYEERNKIDLYRLFPEGV